MKILLYDWNKNSTYINKQDIHDTFRQLGISFDTFLFDFEKQDIAECEAFFEDISTTSYDFCFSINYFPEISELCMAKGLKYISWGYDCPFNVRNIEKTLGNPCNYVFCFDRVQAQSYRSMGFDTVYHLPLGINALRYQKINPSSEQRRKYAAQISFIGSLYEGQYCFLQALFGQSCKTFLDIIASPNWTKLQSLDWQLSCQPHSHCRPYLVVTA